ncbi:MAG TPA: DNA polymerase subunit beta [Clostridiaceae bacterium]|nr:DNA polymerase subunit beta [Clostridiaceae bacterium]
MINVYINEVKLVLGERLKKVMLFGSYARGDFDEESDIDIMLMIDDDESNLNKYDDILTPIEVNINLNNDVFIVPVLMSEKKFEKYENVVPFYRNVVNEGVILYEQ